MNFSFVYELMRAYKGSSLLVNKRLIGGRVREFVDVQNSYKQIVRDDKGIETLYQYFEFEVPFYLKREKAIERYLKQIERVFQGNLLFVSDDEINRFNTYWNLEFIGKTNRFLPVNSAKIISPDGREYYFSLEEGKELSDVFEVMFKPLPYTAGVI